MSMEFESEPCWCLGCKTKNSARASAYKRLGCRDFAQGICTRGESCKFAHIAGDNPTKLVAIAGIEQPLAIEAAPAPPTTDADDEGFEVVRSRKITFDTRIKDYNTDY